MKIPLIVDWANFADQFECGNSIAIVGNSGNIIGSNAGSKINKFDRVIRFNHAKITGFENDVGSRTTDLVINCHVYDGHDLGGCGFESFTHDFWDFYDDALNVIYVNTNPPNLGRGKVPDKFKFYLLTKQGFDLSSIYPYHLGTLPTIGYAFIATLINHGIKPTIFGFSLPNDGWDHYFENRPKPSVSHDHEREKYAISQLIKDGLVEWG